MNIAFTPQDQLHLIPGPAGALELALRGPMVPAEAAGAVAVLCHPHPLHGGTMDNKVVTTLARTYRDLGFNTIRFNFRGVGRSAGEHGYLSGEVEDLQAVLAFVSEHFPGQQKLLAGFSFGSAVAAQVALAQPDTAHLVLVAPPIGKYDLSYPGHFPLRTLAVMGAEDEVVDRDSTRAWAKACTGNFAYAELSGTGHFFHGKLGELRDLLRDELEAWDGSATV